MVGGLIGTGTINKAGLRYNYLSTEYVEDLDKVPLNNSDGLYFYNILSITAGSPIAGKLGSVITGIRIGGDTTTSFQIAIVEGIIYFRSSSCKRGTTNVIWTSWTQIATK